MNTITTHMSQHAFRITTILTVYCSALAWSMLVMLLPIVPIRLLINGLAWYLSVILNKQSSQCQANYGVGEHVGVPGDTL